MVALPCMYLQDDTEIDDCRICRGYEKGGSERTVHVIGGCYSSDWARRNGVVALDCRACLRFNADIPDEMLIG